MSRTNRDPSVCLRHVLRRTREGTLSSPTPLPLGTLRDGGQIRRAGGHFGRCGETRGEEGAVEEEPKKAGRRFSLLFGNAVRASEAKGPCWDLNIALRESFRRRTRTESPVVWWPSAANLAVVGSVRVPPQPGEGRRTTLSKRALPSRPLLPTLCTPGPPGNMGQFPPPDFES